MNCLRVYFLKSIAFVFCFGIVQAHSRTAIDFTIVGGGPAGLLVVGLLMDLGIDGRRIVWMDPEFKVGRLDHYQNVSANAKTKMFVAFLKSCKVFSQCSSPAVQALYNLDQEKEYDLKYIVTALQDITNNMLTSVKSIKDFCTGLHFDAKHDFWEVSTKSGKKIKTKNVVLATGSHPRVLNYEECKNEIPFDEAIDRGKLTAHVSDEDTIAVIGSAHSAILILKYLSELSVPRIINFYSKPIVYPTQMDGWVLHDNTGLMGITAWWAQEVLEKNPPVKILRLKTSDEIIKTWLPLCTKIIYAAGFERNELPAAAEINYDEYNAQTGVIGPRLFGIGIAFPEVYTDPLGNVEHGVGLPDFMEYALQNVPGWIQRDVSVSRQWDMFQDLFLITLL